MDGWQGFFVVVGIGLGIGALLMAIILLASEKAESPKYSDHLLLAVVMGCAMLLQFSDVTWEAITAPGGAWLVAKIVSRAAAAGIAVFLYFRQRRRVKAGNPDVPPAQ
jgi:hypothetical protein